MAIGWPKLGGKKGAAATRAVARQAANQGAPQAVARLPLIGKMAIGRQLLVLVGLLTVLGGAAAYVAFNDNRTATYGTIYLSGAGELRMLSQRIGKAIQTALQGSAPAFRELQDARERYTQTLNLLAIGGSSSGAICAFNAAWERPDIFRRVYSSVGSFTNLRGGSVYPSLVRKTEPKPIRVYMADTSGDIDNQFGSWPWANQQMASALQYMGYDVRFDWAEGYAHNSDFGGARFPDAMRWLWRKEQHTPVLDTRGDLEIGRAHV